MRGSLPERCEGQGRRGPPPVSAGVEEENQGSLLSQFHADGSAEIAFLRSFLHVTGDVFLALGLAMTIEAAFAIEQWQHDSGLATVHLFADDFLALTRI